MTEWLDTQVYVRGWHLRIPNHDRVFHAYGEQVRILLSDEPGVTQRSENVEYRTYTDCGLKAETVRPGGYQYEAYVLMHIAVAEKIARPCKKCYVVAP